MIPSSRHVVMACPPAVMACPPAVMACPSAVMACPPAVMATASHYAKGICTHMPYQAMSLAWQLCLSVLFIHVQGSRQTLGTRSATAHRSARMLIAWRHPSLPRHQRLPPQTGEWARRGARRWQQVREIEVRGSCLPIAATKGPGSLQPCTISVFRALADRWHDVLAHRAAKLGRIEWPRRHYNAEMPNRSKHIPTKAEVAHRRGNIIWGVGAAAVVVAYAALGGVLSIPISPEALEVRGQNDQRHETACSVTYVICDWWLDVPGRRLKRRSAGMCISAGTTPSLPTGSSRPCLASGMTMACRQRSQGLGAVMGEDGGEEEDFDDDLDVGDEGY